MTTKSPRAAGRSTVSSLAERSRSRSSSAADRLVADVGLAAADLDALVLAELGLRADADLDREPQRLALAGQLAEVEVGLADGRDPRGVDRRGVPAADRVADRLVEHGLAADALDHDGRRRLAGAEAGDADVAGEGARGLRDALLDLGGGHLGLHAHARLGQLGDGGVDLRHSFGRLDGERLNQTCRPDAGRGYSSNCISPSPCDPASSPASTPARSGTWWPASRTGRSCWPAGTPSACASGSGGEPALGGDALGEHGAERLDDPRVELRARAAPELLDARPRGHRRGGRSGR